MKSYGPLGNQWIYSKETGYDLTRSIASPAPLSLETDKGMIKIAPTKSALIIIDMQSVPFFLPPYRELTNVGWGLGFGRNFFLHPEMRTHAPGLAAKDVLLSTVIPAARSNGIRILWVNWGL